jgi:hypothetical protein
MSSTPQEEGAVKPDVKPEGSDHINIKVTDSSTDVFFKIKRTTPLRKVIEAFCKRTGKDSKALRFLYDGERISETDTPEGVCSFANEIVVKMPKLIISWRYRMVI